MRMLGQVANAVAFVVVIMVLAGASNRMLDRMEGGAPSDRGSAAKAQADSPSRDQSAPSGLMAFLSRAAGALTGSSGPEFKVRYGDSLEERHIQCGSNDCPTEQVAVRRLTLQSLSEKPVVVNDVLVNDNEECTANPMAKFAAALKADGRPGAEAIAAMSRKPSPRTMKYGDVSVVPLFGGCEPLSVKIQTDKGESVYYIK